MLWVGALVGVAMAQGFTELLDAQRFEQIIDGLQSGALVPTLAEKQLFAQRRSELLRQIDDLTRAISSLKEQQVVSPAFKWGQSRADVFLQIKLSHRFEAPGCLDVGHIEASTADGRLRFRAECVQATSPLVFQLDFALFGAADHHELERESVGTYLLRLHKASPELWPDIFADFSARASHRSHIWLELEKEHPDDMSDFLQLMEDYIERKQAARTPHTDEL